MKKCILLILLTVVFAVSMISGLNAQALGPQPLAYHSVGLHIDGTVYTWGNNSNGQLGDNTTTQQETPVKVLKGTYSGTTYLGDENNNKITAVALGNSFSIALAADGTVYCWGNNGCGQLGDNSSTQSETPVRVLKGAYNGTTYLGDDSNNKITAVSLGYVHSIALAADGTVYSWGCNSHGRLGDNTITWSDTPVRVLKGVYNGTTYLGDDINNKITAVALGGSHSIALAEDGTLYSWGNNSNGQLGDNTTSQREAPVRVLKGDYNGTTYLGDAGNNKIIAIALSEYNSIALAEDGTVYTWGNNNFGQIGDDTTIKRETPVRVLKGAYNGTTYLGDDSNNKIVAVATGYCYCIALAEDGTVYSWGYNGNGRLGDNTTTQQETPVRVLKGAYDGTTYLGDNSSNKITSVTAGYAHVMALTADGTVYSWGDNLFGRLGDNTTTESHIPVKVKGVGGTGDLALPVKLISFTATTIDGQVILKWSTESEIDNVAFIIERGADKENFKLLAKIKGRGSASSRTDYFYTDKTVEAGQVYYYRLSDVNVQGETTTYPPVFTQPVKPPKETLLEKAYPNPFNPQTNITYHLAEDAQVKITVFDLLGRTVNELFNDHMQAGSYHIYWNGTNESGIKVSNGVYVICMQTGNTRQIQKVIFMK
ncbi:T9SS type A sorting domain-containing protein [candidate division KSB1 bacterium]|nr:T9SS type A sorting domain-containing protein [candidate division KSB1 bacterium]